MEYNKIYNDLINSRVSQSRTKRPGDGLETHHIKPLRLCRESTRYGILDDYTYDVDGDGDDNLVVLTAKEHYIAHLLLAKIHGGAMWYAANQMAGRCSREYSIARKHFANLISENNKGHKHADPEAVSKRFKELWATPEYRDRMKHRKPRSFTEEQKANHRRNWEMGKYEGVSDKIAARLTGVPKSRMECPHCHIYASPTFYKRFHGPKCKHVDQPLSKKWFKLLKDGVVVTSGEDPYVDAVNVVENIETRRTLCNYMKRKPGTYNISQGGLKGYVVMVEDFVDG